MTAKDFISGFSKGSELQQIAFLSRLAADMTVFARDTYKAGSDDVSDPPRLRAFNELQHRVASQLVHLLEHDQNRYPAEVFAKMVVEHATELNCTQAVFRTFEQLAQREVVRASA